MERESERMLRIMTPAPGRSARERLANGLDAFLRHVEEHAHGFRAFHRADATGDQAVRKVYQRALALQEAQILAALASDAEFGAVLDGRPEMRLAVRGWLSFTTAVCLEWLRGSELSREQVRDLCARALFGVLAT